MGEPAVEEKKKPKEEILFFTAYILWMTAGVLKLTMFRYNDILNMVFNYMQNIAYILLLWLFFTKKRDTVKDIIGIGIILICCILAQHSVHNTYIIPVAIFLYFTKDFDFKKILKCTFILQAVIMMATILSSQIGIIEDVIWGASSRMRHALGYDYCAYPAHLLFFMSLIWFSLRKKIRAWEVAIAVALNYIMYYLTDSRADFYLAILGIFGFFIWQKEYRHKWLNVLRSFIVKWGFVIAAVFSILIQAFYQAENSAMTAVDTALSGRLHLGYEALQTYGLSLFGTDVRWIGQGSLKANPSLIYNYVDNAFLKEGISFGIVFLILLAIGFWLLGEYLLANKEYKLSWAVLMSLAYGIINAHLCMMTFDVFILLLGCCLKPVSEADQIPVWKRLSGYLSDNRKSLLRVGLFLALLFVITYIQFRGNSYAISNARMYTWITAGFLLLLGCLCWEKEFGKHILTGSRFGKLVFIFLVIACISDFFVSKQFQYAAFCLLAFGGFFCKCWGTMATPNQLLGEFKFSFKIWFALCTIYCVLCRPSQSGICYSGMYPNAEAFALSMLIAIVIFLSDFGEKKGRIANCIGLLCSLYFLWLSKQTIIILVALLILLLYAAYMVYLSVINYCKKEKDYIQENIIQTEESTQKDTRIWEYVIGLAMGVGAILIIRVLLPNTAYFLGTQITYASDQPDQIGITLFQLTNMDSWRSLFQTGWDYCIEYAQNLNLLGHNSLLEIEGENQWAPNGILMVGYRYGVVAGICYIGVLLGYLMNAVRFSLKKKEFFMIGLVIACVIVGILIPIEQPFVCLTWMILWFGICRINIAEPLKNRMHFMQKKE